ncbi:MAG: hypothetical protein AAFW46_09830 [Pseudomonadota bacterium]
MRLAFCPIELKMRGGTVKVLNYARAARDVLGIEPVVLFDPSASAPGMVAEFERATIPLHAVDREVDLRRQTEGLKLDVAYRSMTGPPGDNWPACARRAMHTVFRFRHGPLPEDLRHAYISDWLAHWADGGRSAAAPHVVALPEPSPEGVRAMRERCGAPADALLLGRLGGFEEFDLEFAQAAVREALERRSDLWFAFVNTKPFVEHPRAAFLPPIAALQEKADFFSACDASIHARRRGESFGNAIAESLAMDRAVLAWEGGLDRNHVWMLEGAGTLYRTKRDLLDRLLNLTAAELKGEWSTRVAAFRPEAAIRRFESVFLAPDAPPHPGPAPALARWRSDLEQELLRLRFNLWRSL